MSATDVELVEVTRGELVESRHRGRFVLLAARGGAGPDIACGDVAAPVYARSALKPVQSTALVAAGFDGGTDALALSAASHNGTDLHVEGVQQVLACAGLDESALQCPADLPMSPATLVDYVRGGGVATPVRHNCSGKHAAMLATCVRNGWPVQDYLRPDHPLQLAIVAAVEAHGGERIATSSVDGCGAPAHALSLTALAIAFAGLAAAPAGSPAGRVRAAMRARPDLVGGADRPVTEFLAEVDGLVCKDGAEGVWAAALPDGRAFAAKIDDGAGRALGPVLAAVLAVWGFTGPAVQRWSAVPVLGGGRPMGEVRPAQALRDLLRSP